MSTLTVISPDMWGHVHADCEASCPCGGPEADCCEQCEYWENDRHTVGSIEVAPEAEDSAMIEALIAGGFLKEEARDKAEIQDLSDGHEYDVVDKAGRKVFVLQSTEEP